ncbi:hypothetical protein [Hyphococcus sp.]|uniref:hypothetical protein n=1 Tax=Hyphococcus sp. TaxID=2038636 RepID=UPI003CCB8478
MNLTRFEVTAGVAGAAGVVAALIFVAGIGDAKGDDAPAGSDGAQARYEAPFATPAGVTLQPLGKAQGYSLDKESAAALARNEIVYADANGLTLYMYTEDDGGPSSCTDECEQSFSPLIASESAEPFDAWSIVERADGKRQWALRGKALYSYEKDVDPGSVAGNSPALTGAPRLNGAGEPVGGGYRGGFSGELPEPNVLPEGWEPAHFFPMPQVETPPGMTVRELPDAAAFSLVDEREHTIYVFNGAGGDNAALECEAEFCLTDWAPAAAPLVAKPFGDFGVREREDGVRQWTFRDKGLYTNKRDLAPGYANGLSDEDWKVATVYALYNPPGVTIQRTPGQGAVLAGADGLTLYRRDGHILQSGGGHNLRRGQPARPAVGRDIGTDPKCGEACLKEWTPFIAPDSAQARGMWNVATRSDGRKQWVYQGYALWSYAGDKNPGDMNGHDIYDIALSHDPETRIDVGTPMDGGAALWWSIAIP